jgi:hypothetical protein
LPLQLLPPELLWPPNRWPPGLAAPSQVSPVTQLWRGEPLSQPVSSSALWS